MKKTLLFMVCLCLLPFSAFAEVESRELLNIFEAIDKAQIWMDELNARKDSVTDSDSLYMIGKAADVLAEAQNVIIMSTQTDSQEEFSASADETLHGYLSEPFAEDEQGKKLRTNVYTADETRCYVCETEYTDLYQQITLYTYDGAQKLLYKQRIALAKKNDDIMFIVFNYNAEIDIVASFATWVHEDNRAETVFMQVFGSNMEADLNLMDWCHGRQDVSELSKELLFAH